MEKDDNKPKDLDSAVKAFKEAAAQEKRNAEKWRRQEQSIKASRNNILAGEK